ncbi:hypothetical protein Aple_014250 [Acrocarpospora pleiomorpha]|uniref:Uncharacterized protein n=1 Tax=Acrocarpospora pleiomorpha TaxID=90975 RepID=A0A5M3XBN0_9ACTN|nr:hypothetical protein Aple_014250 [Acrocarpospora pleiomorpha]
MLAQRVVVAGRGEFQLAKQDRRRTRDHQRVGVLVRSDTARRARDTGLQAFDRADRRLDGDRQRRIVRGHAGVPVPPGAWVWSWWVWACGCA